jgi:glycine hydroxymethyltransferase
MPHSKLQEDTVMLSREEIFQLIARHEQWRAQCMNLIASENAVSSAVRRALDNDLIQRYGNYAGRNLKDRRYTGNRFIEEIEIGLENIVRQTFGAREVELRAISGHVAGLAVIMATCKPGDTVLEISGDDGGHRLAAKAAESPLIDLKVLSLPFDAHKYNVDAKATCRLVEDVRPSLIILGSSNFLFPNPVAQIAQCLNKSPHTVLAYDASHVMGLIACGEFQDPLREGAQVVFGSTHKTLPGPQGGLIFSNDPGLMDAISTAVYPGTVTNHHLMRSPALGIALLEMKNNPDYAKQIIANAKSLAGQLAARGVPVVAAAEGFTQSHTVLIQTVNYGKGKEIAAMLEQVDIMTSYTKLPLELGVEGVRLGTSEATRFGATEMDMRAAADIIADVLVGNITSTEARSHVHNWAKGLKDICYADLTDV